MFWSTIKYDVSTSIGYGVSSSLSNTAYPPQQINTAYPLPLDTAYRSSGTETEILDFHAKIFLPSFRTNPTDCLSLVFRRHFKSLSLDELRSPDFNLLSDQEYSEEEEEEEMAETMEQYMSKTRTDYGSGVRFKELLMKCPQHYLTKMQEVILFYNGLDILTRQILDSRGAVPTKTAADAKKAIQEMAEYSQKWHNETSRGKSTETSDGLAAIQAKLNNLGREIKKVNEKVYAA
ncbi:hypothetical protein Tco_0632490 [Tanacetum coccineum]